MLKLITVAAAAAALTAAPAWALPGSAPSNPGTAHPPAGTPVGPPASPGGAAKPAGTPTPPSDPSTAHPDQTTNPGAAHPTATSNPGATPARSTLGPSASIDAKAKAYGRLCQTESKRHVAGGKGTAFSRCVTAMAKAGSGAAASPRAACAGMSRRHVKGQKGTPFSRCVRAAATLLKSRHSGDPATTDPQGPSSEPTAGTTPDTPATA